MADWRSFKFASPANAFQTNFNAVVDTLGPEFGVAYAVRRTMGSAMEWKHAIDEAIGGTVANSLIGQVTDPTPSPGNDVTRSLGLPPGYGFPRFGVKADGVTMTDGARKNAVVLMTLPAVDPYYKR